MRESITSPSNHPAAMGKLGAEQIAHRQGWETITDNPASSLSSLHEISVYPVNGSTITELTTLDPGTVRDRAGFGPGFDGGWYRKPGGYGYVAQR